MKNNKKVISAALAAVLSILSAAALNANAYSFYGTSDSERYNEVMKDYTEFDDDGYFKIKYNRSYVNGANIMLQSDLGSKIKFGVPKDSNSKETISRKLAEIFDDTYVINHVNSDCLYFTVTDKECRSETMDKAKELYNVLNDEFELDTFNYYYDIKEMRTFDIAPHRSLNSDEILCVFYRDFTDEETRSKLKAYADENSFDLVAEPDSMGWCDEMFTLIPKSPMTVDEKFKALNHLKDDMELSLYIEALENNVNEVYLANIDLLNSVCGDANSDGKTNIADSTLILQSLGNPDKYKLSAQGKYNADVENPGDGITGMDAVKIEEIFLKAK